MSSRGLNKEDAERIATKLKAVTEEGRRPHTLAIVYHEGIRITQFGIRRGSHKEAGHGHVPAAVHLSQGQARRLADCPMSYEEWVQRMREKNIISARPAS
jgi:hypothetical protein